MHFGIEEVVDIGNAIRFCNPTEKTSLGITTAITNDDNHLTFYAFEPIRANPQEIIGEVKIVNQFGDQVLRIESANVLAVPTQKTAPFTHDDPKDLDHFKCYFAQGSKALFKNMIVVGLQDQFALIVTRHQLIAPLYFCNPVLKIHAGASVPPPTSIIFPDDHLTCYRFSRRSVPVDPTTGALITDVSLFNQFDEQTWKIDFGDLLCVPTEKVAFKINLVP